METRHLGSTSLGKAMVVDNTTNENTPVTLTDLAKTNASHTVSVVGPGMGTSTGQIGDAFCETLTEGNGMVFVLDTTVDALLLQPKTNRTAMATL